jgi:VanZ like family
VRYPISSSSDNFYRMDFRERCAPVIAEHKMPTNSNISDSKRLLSQCGTQLTLCALAVASWTPGNHVVRSGIATGGGEHVAAYAVAAIAMGIAGHDLASRRTLGSLFMFAGIMEFGQLYVPGRTAQLADFYASCLGVLAGVVIFLAIRKICRCRNSGSIGKLLA